MRKTAADSVILAGSARVRPRGYKLLHAAPPQERLQVTVRILRAAHCAIADRAGGCVGIAGAEAAAVFVTPGIPQRFGADAADVVQVEAFAHAHGLTVVRVDIAARSLRLEGTVAQFSSAFGVRLRRARLGRGTFRHGTYRTRSGEIRIPRQLQGIIVGVHGLDNRPVARPHFRLRRKAACRHRPRWSSKLHAAAARRAVPLSRHADRCRSMRGDHRTQRR